MKTSKKDNGVHPNIEVLDGATRMREWGLRILETKEMSMRGSPGRGATTGTGTEVSGHFSANWAVAGRIAQWCSHQGPWQARHWVEFSTLLGAVGGGESEIERGLKGRALITSPLF